MRPLGIKKGNAMQCQTSDLAKGMSGIPAEVPAPMKAIMTENSRALDSLTKKSACSDSDKRSEDRGC
jgi:hypothetical protein